MKHYPEARHLITVLSFIVAVATVIWVFNVVGILLSACSITGILAWLIQVYVSAEVGYTCGYKLFQATDFLLNSIHSFFYKVSEAT